MLLPLSAIYIFQYKLAMNFLFSDSLTQVRIREERLQAVGLIGHSVGKKPTQKYPSGMNFVGGKP